MTRIIFLSMFYNSHLSADYVFDTLMQPAFWFVDSFTQILGPIFVCLVIFLTFTAVFIAYWIGLPYYLEHKNIYLVYFLILLGHYLLINVVFHFFAALLTHPGTQPGDTTSLKQVAAVCKKCILPKPPRTHHCSVCNCCILKMDHHCPWLNNCVGHHNHRYFFLYMVWMVVGCSFLMLFGFEIAWEEFIVQWGVQRNEEPVLLGINRRALVFYETFMTTGCFFTLGGLTLWHAKLIQAGQTSIEAHINRSETQRLAELGKTYRNPYNFGPRQNWHLFLGLVGGRGWSSVLLPSLHPPLGDGLTWDSIYSCKVDWTYGLEAGGKLGSAGLSFNH